MTLRAILCSAVLSVFACPALLATNPAATSVEKSITIGGLSRKYLLFVPPSAGQQMPLVIALHGGGSNAGRWNGTHDLTISPSARTLS